VSKAKGNNRRVYTNWGQNN